MKVVLLVLVIVLGIAVIQTAIWLPVIVALRRRSSRYGEEMRVAAAAAGERVVRGPESAVYRGGPKPYGAVKGNGVMLLTDRRLLFRKLVGAPVEIPAVAITGVRRSPGFRGSRVGGQTHLVVTTADGAEVGFFVRDLEAWERDLDDVIGQPPAPPPA